MQRTSPPTSASRLNIPVPVPCWLLSVSVDSRNSPPGTTGGVPSGDASSARRSLEDLELVASSPRAATDRWAACF